ncbi:glutathione S-transferase U9-like [Chenopodium quinoa]|uniref:glutathione S-transferase U9-like n=1 Tax=Chenopodium quinoa TaxID=63459 RepID=UPI000B76D14B|nr:glutathione S-transferase U9-like [Chenopodium quinoa]
MAETKEEVKLHGMWASPWVRRVTIALKIKGIPYQYFEEDLKNKSQLLLKYNPVKKLVPVLVHQGRPIPESLIILEYIDETWTSSPKLLPFDPYRRAKVRFWANFIDLQIFEKLRDVVKAPDDDEEDKIIKQIQENMNKLEANVKDLYSEGTHVSGETMDILDILMITLLPIINGVEEAISIKFIHPENFPLAFSWMKSGDGVPLVQESAPNHENLVKFLRKLRQLFRTM